MCWLWSRVAQATILPPLSVTMAGDMIVYDNVGKIAVWAVRDYVGSMQPALWYQYPDCYMGLLLD